MRRERWVRNGERHGKFIAVANMKGGVGKTTTVVSLAEALSAEDPNVKILVVDLDPQASASVAIAGDPILSSLIDNQRTLESFLESQLIRREQNNIQNLIHRQISGTWHQGRQLDVALLPCGPHLRVIEKELIYELARADYTVDAMNDQMTRLFQTEVLPLRAGFDYILFDCAPGISPVTEVAIRLSDLVIVPTIPDYLSVYGLNAFYESVWNFTAHGLPTPKQPPSVLVTRMQKTIRQHKEVLESLQEGAAAEGAAYRMFDVQIPISAALVEAIMQDDGLTFVQKYTQGVITEILSPLTNEVRGFLQ